MNLSSSHSAIESGTRLYRQADRLGLLMPGGSRQMRDAAAIISSAKAWIETITPCLAQYAPDEALRLIDVLDLMHRIAFQRPADRQLIAGIVIRAFEARIHGDTAIDDCALYRAIDRHHTVNDPRWQQPLEWQCLTLDRWYEEAKEGFPGLTPEQTRQRTAILLHADLSLYEGPDQTAFKQSLLHLTRIKSQSPQL